MPRASADERTRLVDEFVRLCEIESPSGRERAMADAVAAELRAMGLEVEEDASAAETGSDAGNLLARIPGPEGARSVLLCAHLDTVPLAAPVEVVREDGLLRNRNEAILGADNKAAVATVLGAARRLARDGSPVGVELLFTTSEEVALRGAKAFDRSRLVSEFRLGHVLQLVRSRIAENLLTMQAGLRSTSNDNYRAWISTDNWIESALSQPLETLPGRQMQYSTGDSHLLSAILTQATGRSTLEFARAVLAEPLGFTLSPWPRDPQGIYVGGNDMKLTPRQLLAFGELYLNGGRAGGRQIVPAAWVEASLRPQSKSLLGEGRYYGYGWWICTLAGQRAPHAWGYGGQFVVLVPALDLVIVTTSSSHPDAAANEHANQVYQLLQYIIESMTAALSSPSSGAVARN